MTGVCHTLWREGCSAHTVNETGACSEETILPEEMPTHSDPGSDNLGTGLGTGPVLETGRQQAALSRGGMPAWWGGRRWWLTGGNAAPRRDHSTARIALEVGFAAGSALEPAEGVSSTAWRALVSRCHKHQGGDSFSAGFENLLSNPVPPLHCFSQ